MQARRRQLVSPIYANHHLIASRRTWTVKPTVNQIESHDGMGLDTTGIVSYGCGLSVEPQTYSPRGDGSAELITGDLVTNMDLAHGVTGAQLSMRWMIEHGIYLLCVSSHCALF